MALARYEWQPTTSEIAAQAGIDPDQVVRFDHNTTPFPTPWAVETAAAEAGRLNEYPGASYLELREAAADVHDLPATHVVPGAGIDELVLLSGTAFLEPGHVAIGIEPTYPLYRIATAQRRAVWHGMLWRPGRFTDVIGDLTSAAADADVVWLCSPNNPTGHRVSDGLVQSVLEATRGVVVIDAAYAEFAGDRWGDWVRSWGNLIVLHTLSKAYALAGLRVGYALAQPGLVERLDGVRPPGSISSLGVAIGVEALRSRRPADVVEAIAPERDRLGSALADLGFRVLPSVTNFVLCQVGPQAARLEEELRVQGLVIRSFDGGPLRNYLRFTVRAPLENDRLLEALAERV